MEVAPITCCRYRDRCYQACSLGAMPEGYISMLKRVGCRKARQATIGQEATFDIGVRIVDDLGGSAKPLGLSQNRLQAAVGEAATPSTNKTRPIGIYGYAKRKKNDTEPGILRKLVLDRSSRCSRLIDINRCLSDID